MTFSKTLEGGDRSEIWRKFDRFGADDLGIGQALAHLKTDRLNISVRGRHSN